MFGWAWWWDPEGTLTWRGLRQDMSVLKLMTWRGATCNVLQYNRGKPGKQKHGASLYCPYERNRCFALSLLLGSPHNAIPV